MDLVGEPSVDGLAGLGRHLGVRGGPQLVEGGVDPDAARELVDEYKADTGVDEVSIEFRTNADPDNRATVELLQQMFADVGIDISIVQLEQAELIRSIALGDFEMTTWRRHGGLNPELER
ncbi:MAG: ABC transporter substrate-binding protein, partial [Actinomycetota bacterium]